MTFSNVDPTSIVSIPALGGKLFIQQGAAPLSSLIAAARTALNSVDPSIYLGVGDTYRPYQTQLENWPRNLIAYYYEQRSSLQANRELGGKFTDDAVCRLQALSAKRYAFPGYSRHQRGDAIDFHTRGADRIMLTASTSKKAIGHTGKSNIELWCRSAAFAWLLKHAREYGFTQVPGINEPWHWVYDPISANDPGSARSFASTCKTIVSIR